MKNQELSFLRSMEVFGKKSTFEIKFKKAKIQEVEGVAVVFQDVSQFVQAQAVREFSK